MLPDLDFDEIRDYVLAILVWALGGWGLWTVRGWALGMEGDAGTFLLGAVNLFALLYIFVLLPLKALITAFLGGNGGSRS